MLRPLAGHVESSMDRIEGAPEVLEEEEADEVEDELEDAVVVGTEDDEVTTEVTEVAEVGGTTDELELEGALLLVDCVTDVVCDEVLEALLAVAR
jgi:hypothetical protein